MATWVKLNKLRFELLSNLPYLRDLALSEYLLFANLKNMLHRKKFSCDTKITAETEAKDKLYKEGIQILTKNCLIIESCGILKLV